MKTINTWQVMVRAAFGKFLPCLGILIFVAIPAFAQKTTPAAVTLSTNQAGPNAEIDVLTDEFKIAPVLQAEVSKLVIYRHPTNAQSKGVVSVFINGQYHASLVAGGFSDVCMPSGMLQLKLRVTKAAEKNKDQFLNVQMDMAAGQAKYISIFDDAGTPAVVQIEQPTALVDLGGMRRQVHTLSRVQGQQECSAAAPKTDAEAAQTPK